MIWLDGITDSMDMNLSRLRETAKDREAGHAEFMGSQRVRHNLVTEQQQNILKLWLRHAANELIGHLHVRAAGIVERDKLRGQVLVAIEEPGMGRETMRRAG